MRLSIPAAAAFLLLSPCAAQQYPALAQAPVQSESGISIPLFQKPVTPPAKSVFELGEITKSAESAGQSEVYTSAEIGAKELTEDNVKSVADTLYKIPGFSITRNSRGEQSFILRGMTQLQVPVMFDGVPIYVPYGDIIDTGKLPVSNVSKIQVTKGLSSVLNGPNTLGGVVNVITAKPARKLEASIDGSFADETDRSGSASFGTRQEKFYATMAADYADSKGFSMSKDYTATANENGGIRQNSGYMRRNYSGKLGLTPGENHEYAFAVNSIDANFNLPPDIYSARPRYWRYTQWQKDTYYMVGKSSFGAFDIGSRMFYDKYYNVLDSYDNANYNTETRPYAFHSTYDDYSWGGSVMPSVTMLDGKTFIKGSLSYKKDIHRQQGNTGAAWTRYEAQTVALGLENVWNLGKLTAQAGASFELQDPLYSNGGSPRGDDTAFDPQFGLKYSFTDDMQVYGSMGIKTRFPTLKELYSGYLDTKVPNPDLKKETSNSYEAGTRIFVPEAKTAFSFSVYYTALRDLIDVGYTAAGLQQMQNIAHASYKGFEVSAKSVFVKNNETDLGYTYLYARNTTPGAATDRLANRPAGMFYASDLWKITEKFDLFGRVSAFSGRDVQDNSGNWYSLDGFCTVDANVSFRLTPDTLLRAGGTNLFDKNYFTDYGMPSPGRTLFVRAGMTF